MKIAREPHGGASSRLKQHEASALSPPAGSIRQLIRGTTPRWWHGASWTAVLIVGAGPAGLIAAIRLRQEGVEVRVIDAQSPESGHSQPTVLHPRTLRSLSAAGVTRALGWRGHEVTRLSVYAEGERRALLELPSAGDLGRGAMTLPRDALRQALLRRLSDLGTDVEWETRVGKLEQDATQVRVQLVRSARLDGNCRIDLASEFVAAAFLVGADGAESTVRERLGIDWTPHGPTQFYTFYEMADDRGEDGAHLVIQDGLCSSIYPFRDGISRFSFQITAEMRQSSDLVQLRRLLDSRMPWYGGEPAYFGWSGHAEFNPGLAARFGVGRVLLTGDAAHSIGPLGGQSLNVGIFEASELALRIAQHFVEPRPVPLCVRYGEQRCLEWKRLFGLHPSAPQTHRAQDWVKRNISAMLPNLPASGDELDDLLDQLCVVSA